MAQETRDVIQQLRGVNLNLMLTLSALLSERSVTGAAVRLGLTQPAVSRALAELRLVLGDQLLVRSGNEMLLTPRARDLIAPVQRGLAELGRALRGEARFDASASTRLFRISLVDYVASLLLPPLLARLRVEAPGVQLEARQFPPAQIDALMESGQLDFVILRQHKLDVQLREHPLYDDDYVCLVRADHPDVGDSLDLDVYTSLPHILLNPRDASEGVVDKELTKLGRTRRVVIYQPYFLLVPNLLEGSDLIITMPRRPATLLMTPALRMFEPPLTIDPYTVALRWHTRFHDDPAQEWLRQIIIEIMAER
jgi:DNA-binding transcriptional LysR family regulator